MNYCFLFLTVVTLAAQEVFTKQYSTKKPTGAVTYAALVSISALCMFVVSSGFKFRFCQEILGYTLLFTAAYCAATFAHIPDPLLLSDDSHPVRHSISA